MSQQTAAGFEDFDEDDFDAQAEAEKAAEMGEEYVSDPEKARHLAEGAIRKAERHKGALEKVWDDLTTLIRLVRAWCSKEYSNVPWRTIVFAIGAIVYFVNPFDVIPDFIPGVGYIDDALVIGVVVKSITTDLDAFRTWENTEE